MSEKIDDGGTAFPTSHGTWGMSLRDYFAAHAPADVTDHFATTRGETEKLVGVEPGKYDYMIHSAQFDAICRYKWADAMIKARTGGGENG